MVLAFFIPSVQDQWDRYLSREVIAQYEKLGDDFFEEGHFAMAEEAFQKAFDLSEGKRLDIEMKRLEAKVNRVNDNPTWGSKAPESLNEIDFQYLLHFQKDKIKKKARVLDSYGVFLASAGRLKEAEEAFVESIRLHDQELAHVNLGNLYRQQGKFRQSEAEYRKAIAMDPDNATTHYNLGLLLADQGKWELAEKELAKASHLDPADADTRSELAIVRKHLENPSQ